jgi:ADP-ribose pyrophosphatase YjhB (NUDIX family)
MLSRVLAHTPIIYMKKPNETHFLGNINQKALIFKDGKILLIKYPESDKKASGKWDMPGGRLNAGENASSGFKREVFEEIGHEVVADKIIATGTNMNLSNVPTFFVIYHAHLVDENKPFVLETLEVGEVRWCEPEEFFTLPIVYKEYQEALRPFLFRQKKDRNH